MFPGRNKPAPIDIPPTYAELFPDKVTQEDIDLEQRNIENRLQTHAQRMAEFQVEEAQSRTSLLSLTRQSINTGFFLSLVVLCFVLFAIVWEEERIVASRIEMERIKEILPCCEYFGDQFHGIRSAIRVPAGKNITLSGVEEVIHDCNEMQIQMIYHSDISDSLAICAKDLYGTGNASIDHPESQFLDPAVWVRHNLTAAAMYDYVAHEYTSAKRKGYGLCRFEGSCESFYNYLRIFNLGSSLQ